MRYTGEAVSMQLFKCRCFHAYKTSTRVKGLSPSTLSKSAVFAKKTALEPSRSLAQFPWHKATRSINTFPPDVMLIYRRITPQNFIRLPSKFTGTLESKMFCPRTQHNDQVSNPVLSNCFPPYLPLGILATHHCLPMQKNQFAKYTVYRDHIYFHRGPKIML